jgi:hypothetical protein
VPVDGGGEIVCELPDLPPPSPPPPQAVTSTAIARIRKFFMMFTLRFKFDLMRRVAKDVSGYLSERKSFTDGFLMTWILPIKYLNSKEKIFVTAPVNPR